MTLSHSFEININAPLDKVIKLYSNHDQLSKWLGGLTSIEAMPSKDDLPCYKLSFQLGRRKMKMTETIVRNELPEHYDVIYKMKGVTQMMKNTFHSTDANTTKWVAEVEYRFKGLMNLIARFMKSGFEQQSIGMMRSFKVFAEKH